MLWTALDVRPKGSDEDAPTPSAEILKALKGAGVTVLEPSAAQFESQVPQAARKGEKVYHVKGFRGSKDGTFMISGREGAFVLRRRFSSSRLPLRSIRDHAVHATDLPC